MGPLCECGNIYFVGFLFYLPRCLEIIVAAWTSGLVFCEGGICYYINFLLNISHCLEKITMFLLLCSRQNHSVPKFYNVTENLVEIDLLVYVSTSKPFDSCELLISLMVFFDIILSYVYQWYFFRFMTEVSCLCSVPVN